MPRKSTVESVAEVEQVQPENVRSCVDCGATEGVPDPRCVVADLCPACADQLDKDVEGACMAADETHVERADRYVKLPLSETAKADYLKQLTQATLRIRELKDEKRAAAKQFSDRITSRQEEAIAAAMALDAGGIQDNVPCECIWDLPSRTYTERTIDTGETVTERPLTTEEIERFQQMHLPGLERPKGSWLGGVPTHQPAPPTEDDDDDSEDDDEDLEDEEDLSASADDLEDEDDPDGA